MSEDIIKNVSTGREESSGLIFEQFAETLKTRLTEATMETRTQFLKIYDEWKEARTKTIEEMKNIAAASDEVRFGSNVSRLVGSSVGIVGGILMVVGAALAPFTAGLSALAVAISGTVATVVGAGTNIAAHATTTITHTINKEKVKTSIKHDCKITEKLLNVIKVARCRQILKVLQDIKEYISKSHLFQSGSKNTLLEISDAIESCFKNINAIKVQEVINLLLKVVGNVKNPLSNVEFYASVGEVTTAIQSAGAVATLVRNNAAQPTVGLGILGAVGVAYNIADIVITSRDVHEGSQSPFARELEKCIQSLNEEMTLVQSLKDTLTNQFSVTGSKKKVEWLHNPY